MRMSDVKSPAGTSAALPLDPVCYITVVDAKTALAMAHKKKDLHSTQSFARIPTPESCAKRLE